MCWQQRKLMADFLSEYVTARYETVGQFLRRHYVGSYLTGLLSNWTCRGAFLTTTRQRERATQNVNFHRVLQRI